MIEYTEFGETLKENLRRTIISAFETALCYERREGNVTVLVTTAEEIRRMNRKFRKVDAVTDVLTFPAWEGEELLSPPDGYLGDVAICFSRAAQQAKLYGHSLKRELAFLSVHGALHLLGYDHLQPEDEAVMCKKQEEILSEMGIGR